MNNMKQKSGAISLALFMVISLNVFFGSKDVLAVNECSTAKPGFLCVDVTRVSGETGCVSNLCLDDPSDNVKCCKMPSANDGSVASNTPSPAGDSTAFTNPLRFQTVDQFLSQIMGALQGIIVTLSLLMIVIGAVMYVISGGGKQIETAKNMITAALVGLALGLAAPSFLKEISSILGWGTADTRLTAALSLSEIAIRVLNFMLGTLGILSLVMMVIGASMYLTSAGDEDRIDTGKKIFKSAILGVIIAMSAMVLVTQVARFFVTN